MTTPIHDVFFPSPARLQEIACTAFAIATWRQHIDSLRSTNALNELNLQEDILVHRAPPLFTEKLNKHLKLMRISLLEWTQYHFIRVFCFTRCSEYDIFKDFDDFAVDFDGSIDYDETAKRMLRCDKINCDEKFKIACLCCLEEKIHEIRWVSKRIDLRVIPFDVNPLVYFWVCHLWNLLDRIPKVDENKEYGITEIMLYHAKDFSKYRHAVVFFWDHFLANDRALIVYDLIFDTTRTFSRYILPKISPEDLNRIVFDLVTTLADIEYEHEDEWYYALRSIVYCIENLTDENKFIGVYKAILIEGSPAQKLIPEDRVDLLNDVFVEAPQNFKRKIIHHILTNANNDSRAKICDSMADLSSNATSAPSIDFKKHERSLFEVHATILSPTCTSLLFTILCEASVAQRRDFLYRNWPTLVACKDPDELDRLTELCLSNENEGRKLNRSWCNQKKLSKRCASLVRDAKFVHVTYLLKSYYWVRSKGTINDRKRALLKNFSFINRNHFGPKNLSLLLEFIYDAFENDHRMAAEYKTKLLNSLHVMELLTSFVKNGKYSFVMRFIYSLASEEDAPTLKKKMLDLLRRYLIANTANSFSSVTLREFCLWCCDDCHERVARYKRELPFEEIERNWLHKIERMTSGSEVLEEGVPSGGQEYLLRQFVAWYTS